MRSSRKKMRQRPTTCRPTVERLESRAVLAVVGAFDSNSGVFAIQGTDSSDRIDIEISSAYVTAWNNGVPITGDFQEPLDLVKQLNVGGRSGNDTINVVQKAEWPKGKVNLYGDTGMDTLIIDVRTDGAAGYAALGQAGMDQVRIPNRLPVYLDTPDETPIFGRLALAQRELRNANVHPEMLRYDDIVKMSFNMVQGTSTSRNAATYSDAIDQFDVKYGFTNRYGATSTLTFCNFFANDVMTAMGVQLPTYQYGGTHTKSRDANYIASWLADPTQGQSPSAGWKLVDKTNSTSLAALLAAVRAGKPAVAVYRNSSGPGHIAVVRPDQDANFVLTPQTIANLIIAQAGSYNFSRGTLWQGFGTQAARDGVTFYYHD